MPKSLKRMARNFERACQLTILRVEIGREYSPEKKKIEAQNKWKAERNTIIPAYKRLYKELMGGEAKIREWKEIEKDINQALQHLNNFSKTGTAKETGEPIDVIKNIVDMDANKHWGELFLQLEENKEKEPVVCKSFKELTNAIKRKKPENFLIADYKRRAAIIDVQANRAKAKGMSLRELDEIRSVLSYRPAAFKKLHDLTKSMDLEQRGHIRNFMNKARIRPAEGKKWPPIQSNLDEFE